MKHCLSTVWSCRPYTCATYNRYICYNIAFEQNNKRTTYLQYIKDLKHGLFLFNLDDV